jgi:ubiquinone/menaquinone biosynthesis C-methylase UbiE
MREFEDHYWWFVARRHAAVAFARDYWPILTSSNPRALDAGCGTGAMLAEMEHTLKAEAHGTDLSWQALHFTADRGNRRLTQADLRALPYADDTFDVVTALDVLEHIEDDAAAAREILRVLRPGGALIASVPAYRALWSSHDVALHHHRRYSAHGLRRLLRSAGFQLPRITFLMTALFPAVALYRLLERIRRRPDAAPEAHVVPVPGMVNKLLLALLAVELAVARRVSLPFGVSLLAVGRKPVRAEAWSPAADALVQPSATSGVGRNDGSRARAAPLTAITVVNGRMVCEIGSSCHTQPYSSGVNPGR